MEKTPHTPTKLSENLTLIDRKALKLEGIVEIISSSENNLTIKMQDTILTVIGQNMNITKLDIGTGILEVVGSFSTIQYGKTGGFFKRIFK